MSLARPYSLIRVRKSMQNQKNKQKELFKDFAYSNQLRKQLHSKLNPENSNLFTARTQLMINSKKTHMPELIITSERSHLNTRKNSLRSKTVTGNKGETTHVGNARYSNDLKPTFRIKNVSYLLSPMKSSFSQLMTPKAQHSLFENAKIVQNFQESKENDREKINFQSTKLVETKSIKRLKDEKCLIATTRKLPFSLERRNTKKKLTEKTNFTNNAQDLFDLDISTIMDENETDTLFIRRDSGFESIMNIT